MRLAQLSDSFKAMLRAINGSQKEAVAYAKELETTNVSLKAAIESARESEKVKTEFLANVSHELRTPLNSIIGFSSFLVDELQDLKSDQVKALNLICGEGQHLLELINNILEIDKVVSGNFRLQLEEFELKPLLENLRDITVKLKENKDIKVELSYPENMPKLYTDKACLKQLLLNLLSNAAKFTQKGKITIKVQYEDNFFRFEVADTGIGIKAQDIPKIFDRFRQLDGSLTRMQGGTGIGLALVKEFVSHLKGEICVTSKPNKGSVFYFTIPNIYKGAV
jgi:signal transduction histidine kinase